MAFQDLTEQEQQILASWLGAMRDYAGARAEIAENMTALQFRYDAGVYEILTQLDPADVIDDNAWRQGKDEMTSNDASVLLAYMNQEIAWFDADAGIKRAMEGASGRSVEGQPSLQS